MKSLVRKNSEVEINLGYKNILLFLFILFIAVTTGVIVVYFPEFIKWLIGAFTLIGLFFLAFHSPFYSFLLFIITLPLEAAFVFEVGFTIRISYLILLISLFALFFSRKKLHFRSPLNLPIFLFLGIATLSLLMTIQVPPPEIRLAETMQYRGSEFRSLIQLLILFLFISAYFLTLHFCSDENKLNKVLKTYIFVALIISLYGIYQFFAVYFSLPFVDITTALSTSGLGYGVKHYTEPSLFRSHATFQEPLNLGNYILSILPFLVALYLSGHKKNHFRKPLLSIKPNLFIIFIFVTSLLLTKSRGAWAGFIIALGLIFLLMKMKYKFKIIAMVAFIIIFFSIVLLPFMSSRYDNLVEFITFRFREEILSKEPRIVSLLFLFDIWKRYPIFGVGIGNYGFYAAQYFDSSLIVSGVGTWLQNLVEKGIFGFLSFILLIFIFYKIAFRSLRMTKNTPWYFYTVGFLASFTGMLIQYLFSFDRFPLYFWVFLGISIATFRLMENKIAQFGYPKS